MERSANRLKLDWPTIDSTGRGIIVQAKDCFRVDRLDGAKPYGDHTLRSRGYSVERECQVLLPEPLSLEPEALWRDNFFQQLIAFIPAGAEDAPQMDEGELVDGIAGAALERLRQLGEDLNWSGHTKLRLYATLNKGLGHQAD